MYTKPETQSTVTSLSPGAVPGICLEDPKIQGVWVVARPPPWQSRWICTITTSVTSRRWGPDPRTSHHPPPACLSKCGALGRAARVFWGSVPSLKAKFHYAICSKLVRSWFEPVCDQDSVIEFGFEPVCDQLRAGSSYMDICRDSSNLLEAGRRTVRS